LILRQIPVGYLETNCYIVGSEKTGDGMIIDPGDEAFKILQAVKELGLTIKIIAITHGHPDHTGALPEVKQYTGARVAIHQADAPFIQDIVRPDILLKGGDTITVGDLRFLVLHTPGHSPGGICLLGDGIVFTGDTLFQYSIGRTDFPGGSTTQLLNSIHTKLMVLPDKTIVYNGHGPSTTIGAERRYNPYLRG